MKDLIIGFSSKYDFSNLQYWVNSIKKSGFDGDLVIVSDNITRNTIDKLTAKNVELVIYGRKNDNGDYVAEQSIAPHVNRFFYIWNALKNTKTSYRYVITTDTRDVVFQKNPSLWLEDNLVMHNLVASSEGMRYKDEPWNDRNMLEAFGPFYHNLLKDNLIYNVGVIAGDQHNVTGLMSLIFQLSINRPIPIVDQAVYNYILNTEPFSLDTYFTTNSNLWAIQLATTVQAIQSGSGDLGQYYLASPANRDAYHKAYEDTSILIENGLVLDTNKKEFTVVHQWDRVPELKTQIHNIYGDDDAGSEYIHYRSI